MGPPKSVVLICLNVTPYTFLSPIAQYLFVAQSGGAPNTNVLATVLLLPPPPDEPPPHAPARSASESTAAPRAYVRCLRMGTPSFPSLGLEPHRLWTREPYQARETARLPATGPGIRC